MQTIGIDVAAQAMGTVAACVEWSEGRATVVEVVRQVNDAVFDQLLDRGTSKGGLDVPLGWPTAFVDALALHHPGGASSEGDRRLLTARETDREVHRLTGSTPLSVSAYKLAHPAMRVAFLLGRRGAIDRTGDGPIVEVYPAVALRALGLSYQRYKKAKGRTALTALVTDLRSRAPWLAADAQVWTAAKASDDVFDAIVCALVAHAKAFGRCHSVPAAHRQAAASEGWIAIPVPDSLASLATA
jgi:predicted RNase H-like nuclease